MNSRVPARLVALFLALSSATVVQASDAGHTPWVRITEVSVDEHGERTVIRDADVSQLVFTSAKPTSRNVLPADAPFTPDAPESASSSMTRYTVLQQSGGYERVTFYQRANGNWVLWSDGLLSCRDGECQQRPQATQ